MQRSQLNLEIFTPGDFAPIRPLQVLRKRLQKVWKKDVGVKYQLNKKIRTAKLHECKKGEVSAQEQETSCDA